MLGLSEAVLRTSVAVDKKEGTMSTNWMHIITGEKLGAGTFKPEFLKDFRTNPPARSLQISTLVIWESQRRLTTVESFGLQLSAIASA